MNNELVPIAVLLAAVGGYALVLARRRAEKLVATLRYSSEPIPRKLTEYQLECLENAKRKFAALVAETANPAGASRRMISWMEVCLRLVVLSHFRTGPDARYGSFAIYNVRTNRRLNEFKEKVLLPRLLDIVGCSDPRRKAFLVCIFQHILTAEVFSRVGREADYGILCEVFGADLYPNRHAMSKSPELLLGLGFSSDITEQGIITWHWKG